jgi:hypothetical protein
MRTVLIRVEGVKRPIHKMQLREGTRVSDILGYLNVPEGSVLARAAAPTNPFPHEAEVHALVYDADHLIARSSLAAAEDAPLLILNISNEEEQL